MIKNRSYETMGVFMKETAVLTTGFETLTLKGRGNEKHIQ
jgi:hypothetical protein